MIVEGAATPSGIRVSQAEVGLLFEACAIAVNVFWSILSGSHGQVATSQKFRQKAAQSFGGQFAD